MRRTQALIDVATQLLTQPRGRHYGYDVSRAVNRPTGVVYPILHRLRGAGWLSDGWESTSDGKPARRYYVLTELGTQELADLVGEPQAR